MIKVPVREISQGGLSWFRDEAMVDDSVPKPHSCGKVTGNSTALSRKTDLGGDVWPWLLRVCADQ